MMKRKIILVLLIIITLMSALTVKTFAADTYSATLTPSSTRVTKGSEVTVTLKLSGIKVDGGISVLEGILKFESDILSITKSDIKAADGWVVTYNENTSMVTIDGADATTSDLEIATFKFKVKEETTATTAAVQFASIAAGNATISEKVRISDATTNIAIGSGIAPSTSPTTTPSSSPSPTTGTNPTATPSAKPTTTPSGTANVEQNNAPATTKVDSDMPDTGAENYVLPLIVVIAILGVVSFIGYKKVETK